MPQEINADIPPTINRENEVSPVSKSIKFKKFAEQTKCVIL